MNTELFKKIDRVISPGGETDFSVFNMTHWEDERACGTVRCVAGWAIHLTTGMPLFTEDELTGDKDQHPSVDALGVSQGSAYPYIPDIAAELLGLGDDHSLFYTDEETAAEFVRLAAQGREDEAYARLEAANDVF